MHCTWYSSSTWYLTTSQSPSTLSRDALWNTRRKLAWGGGWLLSQVRVCLKYTNKVISQLKKPLLGPFEGGNRVEQGCVLALILVGFSFYGLVRCLYVFETENYLPVLYNYGMIFFYINHFSLIIFYHSVWLGFELFGLVHLQVHTHWVQFTLVRRGYDNHKCHNKKTQIGN